ncbi:hypothetical protein FKM82_029262 [Ascaphus truei]
MPCIRCSFTPALLSITGCSLELLRCVVPCSLVLCLPCSLILCVPTQFDLGTPLDTDLGLPSTLQTSPTQTTAIRTTKTLTSPTPDHGYTDYHNSDLSNPRPQLTDISILTSPIQDPGKYLLTHSPTQNQLC